MIIKDLMIDLETMGNGHSPVITSIGAVIFNIKTGETYDSFYRRVNMRSCEDIGLKYDESTIKFWLLNSLQSDGIAVNEILDFEGQSCSIQKMLHDFYEWFNFNELIGSRIWANGIHSDLVWLKSAYNLSKIDSPWDFRMERDVRTLVDFNPKIKKLTQIVGTDHNALSDCYFQIKYCSDIFNTITVN
jgi:hypothetical protein